MWRSDPRPGPDWEGVVLEDALREPYDFGRATRRRLTLLAILRGHWDPYSIQLLKELRNAEQAILDKGFQIIAVTPESPYRVRGLLDQLDLPFVLCGDPGFKVARSLGLAGPMPEETEKTLAAAGIRFRESPGDAVPQMARQGLVILGEDGRIYIQVEGLVERVPFSREDILRLCTEARSKSTLKQ